MTSAWGCCKSSLTSSCPAYPVDPMIPAFIIMIYHSDYYLFTITVSLKDMFLSADADSFGKCSALMYKDKTKDEIYESFTALYSAPTALSVPFANHSTISAESIYIKNSVDIKAIGEGGSEEYTYQISVLDSKNNQWKVLKEYGTDDICTYTPDEVGQYQIRVRLKDSQNGTMVTRRFVLNVEKPQVPYDELIVFLKMPIFLFSIFVMSFKAVFNIIL